MVDKLKQEGLADLRQRVKKLEQTNWQKVAQAALGVVAPQLEQLAKEPCRQLEIKLIEAETAIEDLTETTANLTAARLCGPAPQELEQTIKPIATRLAREAISLQLGITDVAPLHGARWADDDERKLLRAFNSFIRAQSVQLGRTESGLRIKLLRLLRDEHPADWTVAERR